MGSSNMKTVYHYTNKSGFAALSSGATWYPSTGIPLNTDRSLPKHMQLSIMRAQELFFQEQYKDRDYVKTRSAHFPDVHYGPGWYVTETPPDATTHLLLTELWQGSLEAKEKTDYWLRLSTPERRLKWPDPTRPSVAYLPIYEKLGGDSNRPVGGSDSSVSLVEAGRRAQNSDGQVHVEVVHSYHPPIEVIAPFLTVFDGWSVLLPDKQCNILGFLGFDSGFPGVPFPSEALGLSLNRKQLFAIAQIATRSLGTELELLGVSETGHTRSEEVFSFDFRANLTIEDSQLKVLVHCRHQESPMRLEHAKELLDRAKEWQADAAVAFITSTFAENSLIKLRQSRIAPVLVTSSQRRDSRVTMRMAIMDGEVVEYPAHDFWIPVPTTEDPGFEKVRKGEQILRLIGRAEGEQPL